MNLAKVALIGAGLYLLWRNTSIEAPAPSAGQQPPSAPPSTAANGAPVNGAAPANGAAVVVSVEELAKKAANGDAAAIAELESRGMRYNADQWSWYRASGGGGVTTVDLFPDGDRGYLMSASEYLERRQAAGLSGLGGWR